MKISGTIEELIHELKDNIGKNERNEVIEGILEDLNLK